MKRVLLIILIFLGMVILHGQNHYEKYIQRWEKKDKISPPARNSILFIGSSSIRMWKTLAKDFPEVPVINRGFGGSQTSDVLYFMDRIVFPYKPKSIVFYCGENDIAAGKRVNVPVDNFISFVKEVWKKLPQTKVYYVCMKPSPLRWKMWKKKQKADIQIKAFCKKHENKNLFYIDVSKAMIKKGKPDKSIFIKDMLHMNAKGYKIWTNIIKGYLVRYGDIFPVVREVEEGVFSFPLFLPPSLEKERENLERDLRNGQKQIREFAKKYGWKHLVKKSFIKHAEIYDSQQAFIQRIRKLCNVPNEVKLPSAVSAVLEKEIFISVSPEVFLKIYPAGKEKKYFQKIVAHEIAHRLHVRILNGNEDAMGPIWFFEGFAIYAAKQFRKHIKDISKEKMFEIIMSKKRKSYLDYNSIFHYFLKKTTLKKLLKKAADKDFMEWLKGLK